MEMWAKLELLNLLLNKLKKEMLIFIIKNKLLF